MEEIKRINSRVAKLQIARLTLGVGGVALGMALLGKYIYHFGFRACQKILCKEFPDEYEAMTMKLIKEFDKNKSS